MVKLINITPDPEKTCIYIARVSSNKSEEKKKQDIEKLIRYLIKNDHWSPFEHAFMTVEIKTSRTIGRQLLRHRSFTFQEFSQRYAANTDLNFDIELRKAGSHNRQSSTERIARLIIDEDSYGYETSSDEPDLLKALEEATRGLQIIRDAYFQLIKAGVATETARFILPEYTETKLYMSGSLRSWIHFLKIRDDEHSQKEIQQIAREIKRIFIQNCPNISEALALKLKDGK